MTIPNIPAHCISVHKMYPAKIVYNGATHRGCNVAMVFNLHMSLDRRFTNLPVPVSLRAFCDNKSDWKLNENEPPK